MNNGMCCIHFDILIRILCNMCTVLKGCTFVEECREVTQYKIIVCHLHSHITRALFHYIAPYAFCWIHAIIRFHPSPRVQQMYTNRTELRLISCPLAVAQNQFSVRRSCWLVGYFTWPIRPCLNSPRLLQSANDNQYQWCWANILNQP